MRYEVLSDVDELIAPTTLRRLLNVQIDDVHVAPFKTADSLSGGRFLSVTTNGGRGPKLVVKRFSHSTDWIMRATADTHGRAVRAWTSGLLDELPGHIVHGYRACSHDGEGWAILLDDMSNQLVPAGDSAITAESNERLVQGMARFHAGFLGRSHRLGPEICLSQLEADYRILTPETGRREAEGDDPVPRMLLDGWDVLTNTVESSIATALLQLAHDPAPLCAGLRTFRQTLVHADWKLGNLGLTTGRDTRVIVLDWSRFLVAPPAVDLAWYLAVNSARLPIPKEEVIEGYFTCLQATLDGNGDQEDWQAQIDLALLGAFLQLGWSKALGAVRSDDEEVRRQERAELVWWCNAVRPAIDRL